MKIERMTLVLIFVWRKDLAETDAVDLIVQNIFAIYFLEQVSINFVSQGSISIFRQDNSCLAVLLRNCLCAFGVKAQDLLLRNLISTNVAVFVLVKNRSIVRRKCATMRSGR